MEILGKPTENIPDRFRIDFGPWEDKAVGRGREGWRPAASSSALAAVFSDAAAIRSGPATVPSAPPPHAGQTSSHPAGFSQEHTGKFIQARGQALQLPSQNSDM